MSSDPIVILAARPHTRRRVPGCLRRRDRPTTGSGRHQGRRGRLQGGRGRHRRGHHGLRPVGRGWAKLPRGRRRSARASPRARPPPTVNKMCGSAMRAVMLAADQILAGSAEVIVAGGLESMTQCPPTCCPKPAPASRMGHQEVLDHMFFDGLQSPWDGQLTGLLRRGDLRPTTTSRGRPRMTSPPSRCGGPRPPSAAARSRRERNPGAGQEPQGRNTGRQGRDAPPPSMSLRFPRSRPPSRRTGP